MRIHLVAPPNETKEFDIPVKAVPSVIKWGLSLWRYDDTVTDENDDIVTVYVPAEVFEVSVS